MLETARRIARAWKNRRPRDALLRRGVPLLRARGRPRHPEAYEMLRLKRMTSRRSSTCAPSAGKGIRTPSGTRRASTGPAPSTDRHRQAERGERRCRSDEMGGRAIARSDLPAIAVTAATAGVIAGFAQEFPGPPSMGSPRSSRHLAAGPPRAAARRWSPCTRHSSSGVRPGDPRWRVSKLPGGAGGRPRGSSPDGPDAPGQFAFSTLRHPRSALRRPTRGELKDARPRSPCAIAHPKGAARFPPGREAAPPLSPGRSRRFRRANDVAHPAAGAMAASASPRTFSCKRAERSR